MIAADTLSRIDRGASPFNLRIEPYEPIRVPSTIFPESTQYPDWSSRTAASEGYEKCSVLAQVTGDLAEKAGSVPWYEWELGTGRGGADNRLDPVPYIEHPDPRNDLIPGSGMVDRATMHEEQVIDFFLAGHSYLGVRWKGLKRRLEPMRLKVEDPDGVAPYLDSLGRLIAWEWDSESRGGYRYWDSQDVIQVKWRPNPKQRFLGFSLIQALGPEVDAYVELTKLQLTRVRRGAAPGAIVSDDAIGAGTDSVDQIEKERSDVENSLNRNASRHFGGYLVLAGNQQISAIPAFNARQLQLLETLGYLRDRIWSCFGPHPALISSDASTLDNLNVARRSVWSRVVLINARYSNAYTSRFVPPNLQGKRVIAPDYSGVQELQEMDTKIDHLATLVKDCGFAVNSATEMLRIPSEDQPGGDLVLVNANMIPKESAGEPLE